jgi:hypothetical protein
LFKTSTGHEIVLACAAQDGIGVSSTIHKTYERRFIRVVTFRRLSYEPSKSGRISP